MEWKFWTVWTSAILLWVAGNSADAATLSVGRGLEFETLTAAIEDATDGDTLLVAPGVYDSTGGEVFPLRPMASLTIQAASPESRPVINIGLFARLLSFDGIKAATLQGVEVSTGIHSALVIRSSTVTIVDSSFRNSGPRLEGGLIDASDSDVGLIGCEIEYALDGRYGSTILCQNSRLRLKKCILKTRTQTVGFGIWIYGNYCPEIVLEDTIFYESEIVPGPLIHLDNGPPSTGRLVIRDCTATEIDGPSALIRYEDYDAEIHRLNFSKGSGSQVPSPNSLFAITAIGGTTYFSDSEISEKTALGGVSVDNGTLVVENSVIAGNGGDGLRAEYLYLADSIVSNNGQIGVGANHFQIQHSGISNNGYSGLVHLTEPLNEEGLSCATDTAFSGNGSALSEYSGPLDILAAGVHVRRDSQFKRCQVRNNRKETRNGSAGIYAVGNVLLEDCIIEENSSVETNSALFCVNGDAVVSRCQIRGNAIDPDPTIFNYGAIHSAGGGRIFVINSIIAGNTMRNWPLISASPAGSQRENGLFFYNCTVEGNNRPADDTPLIWTPGESFLRVVNTIVWNGESNLSSNNLVVSHSNTDDRIYPGPGNISEDPLFFQPWDGTSADYRLPCESPSVDTGTVDGAPTVDITGGHRPRGAGVDMGAYENCIYDLNRNHAETREDLLFFPTEWYEEVTVDNKRFDFVTGPSVPNRIDSPDLLKLLESFR